MLVMDYLKCAESRNKIARQLESGALERSDYAEGAIILCATINAMSSLLWKPSNGTDRKRFVEIITRFCTVDPDGTRVSAPLLAQELKPKNPDLPSRLGIPTKSWHLTATNFDKTEAEAMAICSTAGIPDCKVKVRRNSYAALLYKEVRCGFMHEDKPGERATDTDQLRDSPYVSVGRDEISYVNDHNTDRRRIHFPLQWIGDVMLSIARGMDAECAIRVLNPFENLGLEIPKVWWIDGA